MFWKGDAAVFPDIHLPSAERRALRLAAGLLLGLAVVLGGCETTPVQPTPTAQVVTRPVVGPQPTVEEPSGVVAPPTPASNPAPFQPATLRDLSTATPSPSVPEVAPGPSPLPSTTAAPVAALTAQALARYRPNELGVVPILEYHNIGRPEGRWRRTPENLRADLERFYNLGFRLVKLTDVVSGHIDIPIGTSPLVLTFDDSTTGQFRILDREGTPVVDPDCAVGIIEDFYRQHTDFGRAATFYVNEAGTKRYTLFGQEEYGRLKLEYLVSHGMEVGNHTLWHQNLSQADDTLVQAQIVQAIQAIHSLAPDVEMETFALPFGAWPKNRALAASGQFDGVQYEFKAVLMAWGGLSPSYYRADFEPYRYPRIQAIPSELDWIVDTFAREPSLRYVSDGNPGTVTFPTSERRLLRSIPGEQEVPSPSPDYTVVQVP